MTAENVTLDPELSKYLGPALAIASLGQESPEEAKLGEKRRQRFASAMHFAGGFALAFGVKTALTLALATTPPLLMGVIMASTGSALAGLWEARRLSKKDGISFREAMKSRNANKAAGFSLLGAVTFGVADHFLHVGQHLSNFLSKLEAKVTSFPVVSFAEAAQPKGSFWHFGSGSVDLPPTSVGPFDTGIKPILRPFAMAHVPSVTEAFAGPASEMPYAAHPTPLMSTDYNFLEQPTARVSVTFPPPAAEVLAATSVPAIDLPAPALDTPVPADVAAPLPAEPASAPTPIEIKGPEPVVTVTAGEVVAAPTVVSAAEVKPVLDCVLRQQTVAPRGEWPSYMTFGEPAEGSSILQPVCKAFKEIVQAGDLLRGTIEAPNAQGEMTAYTYESTALRAQPVRDVLPKWISSLVTRAYGYGGALR